ncbi:ABC transporter ATP-binding protein [Streptomyces sulphureus]|uniref:ABC transporter ATP-binding protein n=1 Tax=Streptomyces sulphureus TaxID=47758 RepID=UPI000369D474|nr:ABC transporter ATP-binding protein [Streptomyces sulphureus]
MAIIEAKDLRKVYGGKPAVDGVSFEVEEGEIFGVLGPNGAGKTTTVECIEGLRTPDAGEVRVSGLDPVTDRDEVMQLLGAQLQESQLQQKLTVREALELYTAFYRTPADWRALVERLGLDEQLNTRFAKLSGGQKQRLFIALALVGNPSVVVLDELTTGLDPRGRRDTWSLIESVRDSGVTVLLVTHFMEEAQRLCDRVAVIDSGRVVALDTPDGLVRQSASSTVVSFTPSPALDDLELRALPEVGAVTERRGRVTLTGSDETVNALVRLLAAREVSAERLRIEDATLDDAFLDLTAAEEDAAEPAAQPTAPRSGDAQEVR